jgi:ribosomal protein S8E
MVNHFLVLLFSNHSFQALRFTKAHVTHPELKATFQLPIIGVKKNPSSPLYTSLGVITKGTVLEVTIHDRKTIESLVIFFFRSMLVN